MSKLSLLLILLSILAISCKKAPSQSATQQQQIKEQTPIDTPSVQIVLNDLDFQYFQGKGKLDYQDKDNSINAHFNIRIRKDSIIWISISQLGIEGARFLVTKDSIFGINRLNKDAYIFSIKHFQELFNLEIDFKTLQSIIIGNMPISPTRNDKIIEEGKYVILNRVNEAYGMEAYVNIESHKLEKFVTVQKPFANTLNINYSEFKPLLNYLFPYKNSISLKYLGDNELKYNSIYLEFNKVELDEKELKFPFKIPKRFNEP